MDGIHDLGGKEGFGPIEVDEEHVAFRYIWEGREWALSRCARAPHISIDWWRHCRELIQAEDYLNRPYFDSWAQTDLSTYINADILSIEEIKTGKADNSSTKNLPVPVKLSLEYLRKNHRENAIKFNNPERSESSIKINQSVLTNRNGHSGHTRLPQYARGRHGVIHKYHGAHIFPDLSAKGIKTYQNLYSVAFEAAELWPEANGRRDRIFLDLWESYLIEVN
jgi:nitrile hydratase beta subunit|tara:strand:+ start:116 stop:784 length:669 start_codon:yes stop_codon:yes gene_type:complete